MKLNTEHDEIARLAYEAWLRDERPPGRDLHYWLEAERQYHARLMLAQSPAVSPAVEAPACKTRVRAPKAASSVALRAARALSPFRGR